MLLVVISFGNNLRFGGIDELAVDITDFGGDL